MKIMKITVTAEMEDGTVRELIRQLPSDDLPDGCYAVYLAMHKVKKDGRLTWKRWYTGLGAIVLRGGDRAR